MFVECLEMYLSEKRPISLSTHLKACVFGMAWAEDGVGMSCLAGVWCGLAWVRRGLAWIWRGLAWVWRGLAGYGVTWLDTYAGHEQSQNFAGQATP